MIDVEVLYFAQLKDAAGCDVEVVSVENGATVGAVVSQLQGRPEWERVRRLPLSYAVNEVVVAVDHPVRDGDRLALLPPVSGG